MLLEKEKTDIQINVNSGLINKLENFPTHNFIDQAVLVNYLETDADINKLEHQLLKIVNDCIPIALTAYQDQPKKSNADALNLFISQTREISNDIRNLHNKKDHTQKILNDCLKPSIMKIYNQILGIKENEEVTLKQSKEEFDEQIKEFLKQILQEIQLKLEDLF